MNSQSGEPKTTYLMIAAKQDITYKSPFIQSVLLCEVKQEFYSHEVVLLLASINYTTIYLQCGKKIMSTKTLKKFEDPLTKIGFLRIHKAAIINPAYMDNYSPTEVIMHNGLVVKVSRRRKWLMKD